MTDKTDAMPVLPGEAYAELIAFGSRKFGYKQGTPRCVAFSRGAEWGRATDPRVAELQARVERLLAKEKRLCKALDTIHRTPGEECFEYRRIALEALANEDALAGKGG